jgi:hypothetical protein
MAQVSSRFPKCSNFSQVAATMPLNVYKWEPNALYTKWDQQASRGWHQVFPDMDHVRWRVSTDPSYRKAHVFYACDQRNITREPDSVQP